MEELHNYIAQARQQGHSDQQISQALMAGGWTAEQINGALAAEAVGQPSVQPARQPVTQPVIDPASYASIDTSGVPRSRKLPMILVVVVILGLLGGGAFTLLGHKTSYDTVIQQFVSAMEAKNKATADGLESPASKAEGQKQFGISSFYDDCQKASQLCMPFFTTDFQSKAIKTPAEYTAKNGTKGKQITYTVKKSIPGDIGSPGCTITSSITIAAVPKGKSWQVEIAYVDPNNTADPDLCANVTAPSDTSQETAPDATTPTDSTDGTVTN